MSTCCSELQRDPEFKDLRVLKCECGSRAQSSRGSEKKRCGISVQLTSLMFCCCLARQWD